MLVVTEVVFIALEKVTEIFSVIETPFWLSAKFVLLLQIVVVMVICTNGAGMMMAMSLVQPQQ